MNTENRTNIFRDICEDAWGKRARIVGDYHVSTLGGEYSVRWFDEFKTGTFTTYKRTTPNGVVFQKHEIVRNNVWVPFHKGVPRTPQASPKIAAKVAAKETWEGAL